jgi:hypothetical protein
MIMKSTEVHVFKAMKMRIAILPVMPPAYLVNDYELVQLICDYHQVTR